MRETEMEIVGEFIDQVVRNIGNEKVYEEVRKNVRQLCDRFPLYPELRT
jgi:glycine hydroxymethyltransferase